jgi:hypothetical protein
MPGILLAARTVPGVPGLTFGLEHFLGDDAGAATGADTGTDAGVGAGTGAGTGRGAVSEGA